MKRIIPFAVLALSIMFTASTCDRESFKLYRDSQGNTVLLTGGAWGLTEVQYVTAGVVESKPNEPETLMEFLDGGIGSTLRIMEDGSRRKIDSFHYEKYPGSVTIFTEEEYKNNRSYSEEDQQYMPGRTYNFKVTDQNTIWYRERITSGTYLINIFTRF